MDALSRLEPVARPLLTQVDEALATLGAPADHDVWRLLRRVGATPAGAVTFFAALTGSGLQASSPASLRRAADTLREQARTFAAVTVPTSVPWAGRAGEAYAAQAVALAGHLHGPAGTSRISSDEDSLSSRLVATASYVDDVAGWQGRSRDRIARALAGVLSSAEAVTLCAAGGLRPTPGPAPGEVLAAAEIGAHILAAAADALTDGQELTRAWAPRLAELPYRGPAGGGSGRFDAAIRLVH